MDLNEIIEKQAEGIAKALRMPEANVTTYEKEIKKKKPKKEFATRVFLIIDDISALEYAEFINQVFESGGDMEIMREVENWTKDGELIRVVDYVFPAREESDDS